VAVFKNIQGYLAKDSFVGGRSDDQLFVVGSNELLTNCKNLTDVFHLFLLSFFVFDLKNFHSSRAEPFGPAAKSDKLNKKDFRNLFYSICQNLLSVTAFIVKNRSCW
jgi:hypothetical protein